MNQELSKSILHQVKSNYNLCAEEFSATRGYNWPEISDLIEKYVKDGMRVFDVGCGNGRICELLEDCRVDYVGIDNSEELIREAKKKLGNKEIKKLETRDWKLGAGENRKFIVGDILNLPFTENEFDIVLCLAALHHIPSKELRDKAISEIYRVLAPGGILIMSNWNLWQDKYRHLIYMSILDKVKAAVRNCFYLKPPFGKGGIGDQMDFGDVMLKPFSGKGSKRYHHAFTKWGVKKLIRRAGFSVEGCYYASNGEKTNWKLGRNLVSVGKK